MPGRYWIQATQSPLAGVQVQLLELGHTIRSDASGRFTFPEVPFGDYQLRFQYFGKKEQRLSVQHAEGKADLRVFLEDKTSLLPGVTIQADEASGFGLSRLRAVEGVAIFEGKKSEVVQMAALTANLATSNPRQVFSRVVGLNIWESDGAGLQLGIGGRGLSPNRTANFNTRQNGYDISADALGYPESYYTPPAEALERFRWYVGRPHSNTVLNLAVC